METHQDFLIAMACTASVLTRIGVLARAILGSFKLLKTPRRGLGNSPEIRGKRKQRKEYVLLSRGLEEGLQEPQDIWELELAFLYSG